MAAIVGETLTFEQENGPEVELVVFGDEFYARYETVDGYSVVYDYQRGLFCYALLIDGELVSSGVSLEESRPAGLKNRLSASTLQSVVFFTILSQQSNNPNKIIIQIRYLQMRFTINPN
ncbi:hypothetical protein P0O24_11200, partial [Methanotrichaceae archaeon M04Ac]